jgi:hypothetical protein
MTSEMSESVPVGVARDRVRRRASHLFTGPDNKIAVHQELRSAVSELYESIRHCEHPGRLLDAVRHVLLLESLATLPEDTLRSVLIQFERELTTDPFFDGASFVARIAAAVRAL